MNANKNSITCIYVKNMRCYIAGFAFLPMICGSVMLWKSTWQVVAIPLAGFIMLGFLTLPNVMVLSLMTANTSGYTKKAISSAMLWAAYSISNGCAPLLVKTTEITEHYPTLCGTLVSTLSLGFLTTVFLRLYLQRLNKRRDSMAPVDELIKARNAFADLTDKENTNFRYVC